MLSPAEKLSAIEEIKALKALYLRCVDGHDWPGYRSLLTDDCVFCPQNAPGAEEKPWQGTLPRAWWYFPRIDGADAIVGMIQRSHVGIASLHRCFMPEIEIISANEARGIWGIEDIVRWPSTGRLAHGFGHYRDRYVRQDGTWRFKTIEVTRTSLEIRDLHTEAVRLKAWPPASAGAALSPVEKLVAIEDIKSLKARYFRCLDGRDWAGYRSLLTDDCVFCPDNVDATTNWSGNVPRELWISPRADGADTIIAWIKEAHVGATSQHRGYMPEIEIVSANEARGVWGMEDIVRWPGRTLHGFGHYRDVYVRQNGAWRVKSMDLVRTSVEIRNHHAEAVMLAPISA